MNTFRPYKPLALATALLLALGSLAAAAGQRPFAAQKPADAAGTVEIVNVAGSIDVRGWDRPLVDVSGTIGERVERVDVSSSGNRTTVRVVLPDSGSWKGDGEANLKIRVPQGSSLEASLVSADLKAEGIAGAQRLRSVSGDLTSGGGGNFDVETVSGDVSLAARGSHEVRVKSISGDVTVDDSDNTLQVSTVSGDAKLSVGALKSGHFETVSGDVTFGGALDGNGQLEFQSVSGDLQLHFANAPDADFDVQDFSGDILNCFGPKPDKEQFGPGQRLNFRSGKGGGRVRASSHSGDVSICTGK
jgi:hypothetical protein